MARVDACLVSTAGMLSWLTPDWGRQCNRQWSSDIAPGSALLLFAAVVFVLTHTLHFSGPLLLELRARGPSLSRCGEECSLFLQKEIFFPEFLPTVKRCAAWSRWNSVGKHLHLSVLVRRKWI